MATATGTAKAATVERVLRRVRRRWRRVHFWRWNGYALWAALMAGLLLVAADLAWTLSDAARAGLRWTVPLGFVVTAGGYLVWRFRQSRRPERYAMLLEEHDPALETHLINSVQFRARGADDVRGVSRQLMEAEIARGEAAAGHAKVAASIDDRPVRRVFASALGVLVLLLVAHFFYPPVLTAVAPRYLDPYGDHPPFSLTSFAVQPGDVIAVYGDTVEVVVETSGREVESLNLFHRPAGSEADWQSMPFFLTRQGAFVQNLVGVQEPLEYYAGAENGRSYRYRVDLDLAPRILEAEVLREHPAYTGYAPDRRRLEGMAAGLAAGATGNISLPVIKGLIGTSVTVEVSTNRPLVGGHGEYNGHPFEMEPVPSDHHTVAGKLVLGASGTASFTPVDVDGRESPAPLVVEVIAVRDREPVLEIAEPPSFAMAIPTAKLPARVAARDDVGLESVTLRMRNSKDEEWQTMDLRPSRAHAPFTEIEQTLDLEALGAEPGDEIQLFATARDNFPGRSQVGKSPTHRIRIISEGEYRRMMAERRTAEEIARQYEESLASLQELLKKQEDLQEQTRRMMEQVRADSAADLSQAEREQMQALAGQQQALAQQAQQVAREMADKANEMGITPLEEEMNRELAGMAHQLQQLGRQQMARAGQLLEQAQQSSPQLALSGANLSQQDAAEALREMTEGPAQQMEQSLEQLAQAMELMGQLAQLADITEQQRQITAEAEGYRDQRDLSADQQHELVRLAEEERRQGERLEALGEQMARTASGLQENFPRMAQAAQGITQAIQRGAIPGQMRAAAGKFQGAQPEPGYGHARNALAALEELMKQAGQCESCMKGDLAGMMPGGGMGTSPTGMGSGAFSQTLQQLLQNMRNLQNQMAQAPSASRFPIYGAESLQGGRSSPYSNADRKNQLFEEEQEAFAADRVLHLDELSPEDRERLMALKENYPRQYRRYLAGYFKRLAEESSP